VPKHLRDASYRGAAKLGHGKGYVYPHNDPAGIVAQQYAPDAISGKQYYQPSGHGLEARYAERSERIRATLGLTTSDTSAEAVSAEAVSTEAGPDGAGAGSNAPGAG
jgi:putative ATPase